MICAISFAWLDRKSNDTCNETPELQLYHFKYLFTHFGKYEHNPLMCILRLVIVVPWLERAPLNSFSKDICPRAHENKTVNDLRQFQNFIFIYLIWFVFMLYSYFHFSKPITQSSTYIKYCIELFFWILSSKLIFTQFLLLANFIVQKKLQFSDC